MNELRALPGTLFQIARVSLMGIAGITMIYLMVFGFWSLSDETFARDSRRIGKVTQHIGDKSAPIKMARATN